MESKSKEIITLIETTIKKGNADIKTFALNLISELKKIITLEKLKELIEDNLSKKNIYFIRHAESEHNVLESKYAFDELDKWNIHDPKLTERGIEQTNYIKKK